MGGDNHRGLLAAIVSTAFAESRPVENERQKRFDRNRDGQLDDREQAQLEEFARTSERAEKMRAEAKEHEEIARKLRAESEELARNLDRRASTPAAGIGRTRKIRRSPAARTVLDATSSGPR